MTFDWGTPESTDLLGIPGGRKRQAGKREPVTGFGSNCVAGAVILERLAGCARSLWQVAEARKGTI
jgi:hypothetical protein